MQLGVTSNMKDFNHFVGLGRADNSSDEWQFYLEGNTLGNIHTALDSKENFVYNLKIATTNADVKEATVKYKIYKRIHENMHILAQEEKKVEFNSLNSAEFKIDYFPFIDSYNIYYTNVSVYTDSTAPKAEQTFSLSFVRRPSELNERLGMCIHTGAEFDNCTMVRLAADCGVKVLRTDFIWRESELERGIIEIPKWHDTYIDYAVENGIEPLGIFLYCNDLYDEGKTPHTEEGIAAYARFCAEGVRHFKGRVKYYEIWNEYNFWGPFNNGEEPPETYARMLIAAVKAMKEVDPDIKIVACSTCGAHYEWLRRVLKAGAAPYIDILSPHPYTAIPSSAFPDEGKGQTILTAEGFRKISGEFGEEKDLWLTEVGWATQRDISGMTREIHAVAALRAIALTATMHSNDKLVWYDFLNDDLNPYEIENNWGFIESRYATVPYAAKEAYLAVSAYNDKLATATYLKDHKLGSNLKVMEYEKSGKHTLLMWALREDETITLKAAEKEVVYTDIYGNEKKLLPINDKITVTVNIIPFYLEGVLPQEVDSDISVSNQIVSCIAGEWAEINVYRNKKLCGGEYTTVLPEGWKIASIENKENLDIIKVAVPLCQEEQVYQLELGYKLNGLAVASLSLKVEVLPPLTLTVKPNYAESGWQITATVSNNSKNENITGRLKVIEPKAWRKADQTAVNPYRNSASERFSALATQISETVFCAPKGELETEQLIGIEMLLDNGKAFYSYHKLSFMGIEKANTKPIIDGNVTEEKWGAPKVLITEEDFVPFGENEVQSGFEAKIYMKWDEENLYVAARVHDKIHFQDCTAGDRWQDLWDGDSIQMIFDPIREVRTGRGCYNELCFALSSITGEEIVWRFRTIFNRGMHRMYAPERVIQHKGEETLYEIAIPWWELLPDGDNVKSGANYGIAFGVNDNNGDGFKGRAYYGDGVSSWFDEGQATARLARDIILLP